MVRHIHHHCKVFCVGPYVFLLLPVELFSTQKNKLHGYADDSTLVAVVPSLGREIAVTESLNRDLNRVSMWFDP